MPLLLFFFCALLALPCAAQTPVWAEKVEAFSSEYRPVPKKQNIDSLKYLSGQVLGKPTLMPGASRRLSNCAHCWSPLKPGQGNEYITVSFGKPVQAQQVVVVEATNPSAIAKVVVTDDAGAEHTVYEGSFFNQDYPELNALNTTSIPLSAFFEQKTVVSVTVYLDTKPTSHFNHINAIGLLNSADSFRMSINLPAIQMQPSSVKHLAAGVNSSADELIPRLSLDGKSMYWVRQKHDKNPGGADRQAIWMAEAKEDGSWGPDELLPSPVNNTSHGAIVSISPDGNQLFLMGVFENDVPSVLNVSQQTENGWSSPQAITLTDYYNLGQHAEYYFSMDGKTLLMALARKDTYGSKDIYVCFKDEENIWSVPKNLGPVVNSSAGEIAPFLASDGVTLYFGSDGHLGFGNADIFVTRRLDDTWENWSEPVNLGPAVNGPGFDAYSAIDGTGEYMYFTATRAGTGLGGSDIYRIPLAQEVKPNPTLIVSGRVFNAKTKEPLGATIRYERLPDGGEAGVALAALPEGSFSIPLPGGYNYGFRAEQQGFIPVNDNLDLRDLGTSEYLRKDLFLVPIEVGQTIQLNNVFFDVGLHTLRAESRAELQRLVALLNAHPSMTIEVSGHTDNTGAVGINEPLSLNRAQAVFDFLRQAGIAPARMQAKGYAATKPIADNASDEGRKQNRRVEFTILSE